MSVPTNYRICVKGHLDPEWAEWFDGLTITNMPNGEATLTGLVRDQAALNGLMSKVFGLNLELISILPIQSPKGDT